MDLKVNFKSPMFVYAADSNGIVNSRINVFIPEVFLVGTNESSTSYKTPKGNTSIFVNETPPAISPYITRYNYISLPVVSDRLVTITKGNSSGTYRSTMGSISKGDRLIAEFVNNNPNYGIIIGRC